MAYENLGIIALLFIPLILGLVRGSSICLIACAPGIVPYLVSKQYDRRKCIRLAILFNLPRIIVLTILGILVGLVGFYIKEWITSVLPHIFMPVQVIGYGFLGIFILIFGAYMFVTSVEIREDLVEQKNGSGKNRKKKTFKIKKGQVCEKKVECSADSKVQGTSGILTYIQSKFKNVQDKPDRLFLFWGGILSIACLGEIIAIELSIISGSFGIISVTVFDALLLGGFSMFLFAIGASLPIIIIASLAPTLGKYVSTVEKLETVRTIGAMVMIMMGLVFIIIPFGYMGSLF